MNVRRITSLTSFLSFFVVLLTSAILYIAPQGRVAYWVDWRLWGLSKDQWGAIHINVGLFFLVFLVIHIYYNWTPIVLYLKNNARTLRVFTREFNVALVLTVVVILCTYGEIPPFSSIIDISDGFKSAAARTYGEPPYGHAELSSLDVFSKKMGMEPNDGINALKDAGYQVDTGGQTLKELALVNGVTPQQLYLAMNRSLKTTGFGTGLPENPPPGTGLVSLEDFCSTYHLDGQRIMVALQQSGIQCHGKMTLKQIAETNRTNPVEIYERIRNIVETLNRVTPGLDGNE